MRIVLDTDKKQHAFSLLEKFDCMRQERKFCDFVIKVGTENLNVHRNILAASSDYFYAMFSHDTMESNTGIVEMKQVSATTVFKCVSYMYTGKFEVTSVEELDDLFFAINMMQLHTVQEKLSSSLKSCLKPESFLEVYHVALKYGLAELSQSCNAFALENLDSLVDSGSAGLLEFEYISFLLSSELLSGYGYDEDAKLLIAISWIKADVNNRRDKLMALCNLVNLKEVSHSCEKHVIENEEICSNSADFMKMMYLSTLNDKSKSEKPSFHRKVGAVAMLSFDDKCNAAQLHDLSASHITVKPIEIGQLSIQNFDFVAVVAESQIYILLENKLVYALDMKSLSWQAKASMLNRHGKYLRTTFVNGCIYVCGNRTIERFNCMRGKWKVLKNNSICLRDCEMIAYKSQVMTIGGLEDSNETTNVNVFSTPTKTWSKFPSLIFARRTPAASTVSAGIFVVGGFCDGAPMYDVECFDAATKCWTILPQSNYPHDDFKLFAIRNVLYAVSAFDLSEHSEKYDICTQKWTDYKLGNEHGDAYETVILSGSQLELLCNR